jgi:hypothetical protein
MRRIRNPRYAPEFLERRLSPSTVSAPTAQYYTPTYTLQTEPTTPDGSGEPPISSPTSPTGPSGPG